MTRAEVASILGPVDDTVIAEVIATGASKEELAEAYAWLHADEALLGERRRPPSGRVAVLIDIIASDDEEDI